MEPKTIILNAEQQSLGRLASRIALLLRGKHSPNFQPHLTPKQKVMVKNCAKLNIQPKKLDQKVYHRTSGYPGAVKTTSLRDAFQQNPSAVLVRAVRGMLPANKQRRILLQNLLVEN